MKKLFDFIIGLIFNRNVKMSYDLDYFHFTGNDDEGGFNIFNFNVRFKACVDDHNPSFEINWEIMNYLIVEIIIYNVYHTDSQGRVCTQYEDE